MTPSDAEVEEFLRQTESRWFHVPASNGGRRGLYAHLIEYEARRRGWNWHDAQPLVDAAVARSRGTSQPQQYSTFMGLSRLLRRKSSLRETTYYELPADFFGR